jgi:YegS/Rv2252/BmrU family lipid kinase
MYYFIVNPASGSGRGGSVWNTVKAELDRQEVSYRAFCLSGRGEAKQLAASIGRSAQHRPCTIVVVGGDGTIDEVIDGLSGFEHITFGCIPTGSGNDFVRGLDLERDPIRALHTILTPQKIEEINVGFVTCQMAAAPSNAAPAGQRNVSPAKTHSYIVSAGIGFDAAVCNSVQTSRMKKLLNSFHLGKLVYLFTALWQLFAMKKQTLSITTEDGTTHTFDQCYFAAAMNLPYEGGGFQFCPDALPGDDCIDLFVVHGIPRLKVLLLLPLAFSGRHTGFRGIEIMRCHQADIRSSFPMCVHTDGEIPGFYDMVTFSLHKEKLAVILR